MGFMEWLGFGQPRDAPQPNTSPGLPQVTNDVRDSGQTFVFGVAPSGERVDEKSAIIEATLTGIWL